MDTRPSKRSLSRASSTGDDSTNQHVEELAVRLTELKEDLLESERALHESRSEAERLARSVRERDVWLSAQNSHIVHLNSEIAHWKEAFNAVVQSRAWRLTSPLRFAGRAWRSLAGNRSSTKNDEPPAESQSLIPTDEVTLPDPLLDRFEELKAAVREILAGVKDTRAGGIYIHRVADRVASNHLDVKAIALYRTQYIGDRHAPVTDALRNGDWGDVCSALPRYLGHHQPHVPDQLGHCDQRIVGVLGQQVALATQYGIYGLCFEYSSPGNPLFTDPVKRLLEEPALDIRFCICLGGEGGGADTPANALSPGVCLEWLAPAFADPRYISIDGKPVLLLNCHPSIRVQDWFDSSKAAGLNGLYLVGTRPHLDGTTAGFDAILEDPFSNLTEERTAEHTIIDTDFKGHIFHYPELMEKNSLLESSTLAFKNVLAGFDNEPLSPGAGTSLAGANPSLYARWLERACRLTVARRPEERLVFISSWNNWLEGAHLEPDRRFGYGYLHATANVLRRYYRDPATEALIEEANARFTRTSDSAILFHCFYEDLITPIFERYLTPAKGVDLIATVRPDVSSDAISAMCKLFPNIFFLRCENRGRDIRPFLLALGQLESFGYRFACKIHTKKTPHAENQGGESWRHALLERLLGAADSPAHAVRLFTEDLGLGLIVPEGSVMDLSELRNHVDNTFWLDRLLLKTDRSDLVGNYGIPFPAGSMYWFRMEALAGFDRLVLPEDLFEQELGQRDGTLAHALERLVAVYALSRGFQMKEIDLSEGASPDANVIAGRKSGRTLAPLS